MKAKGTCLLGLYFQENLNSFPEVPPLTPSGRLINLYSCLREDLARKNGRWIPLLGKQVHVPEQAGMGEEI